MVRRARPIIRAATGITLSKRIVLDDETIPDVTSVAYDNPLFVDLLECVEAQAEGAISDGSTVADAPLYSRLAAMKLNFSVEAPTACRLRWMLVKEESGIDNIASLTGGLSDANFHGSAESNAAIALRRLTLAKGYFTVAPDRLVTKVPVFIRRAAMKRVSPLKEDDKIVFVIAKNVVGSTATLSGFGTIWVKANA